MYLYTYSPTSTSIYQVRDVEDRADLLRAVDEDQARLPDSAQPHRPDTFPRGGGDQAVQGDQGDPTVRDEVHQDWQPGRGHAVRHPAWDLL